MIQKLYDAYNRRITIISRLVESCYISSMTIFIFINYEVEGFLHTNTYTLFASLFIFFGMWHFSIKKDPMKKLLLDTVFKTVGLLVAIIIIDKLTGVIKTSGLYSAFFFPITIIFMYWLKNRKSKWSGFSEVLSASEYREKAFGLKARLIPDIFWYFIILIVGIFNIKPLIYVSLLAFSFLIDVIFVWYYVKKKKSK